MYKSPCSKFGNNNRKHLSTEIQSAELSGFDPESSVVLKIVHLVSTKNRINQ